MWEIVKFEIGKLLRKKIVWAAATGMFLLMALMTWNWITPAGFMGIQQLEGDKLVALSGREALQINKEISDKYTGPLTDELVKQILEEGKWPDEVLTARGLEPAIQRYYLHNETYTTVANNFAEDDGTWNGKSVEDVFGEIAPKLWLGYSQGWESALYAMIYTMLSWGCVLIIIIAPLFAEEYTRGTDALILTGAYGKNKCAPAKIIAAFFVSTVFTVLIIAVQLMVALAYWGTEGLKVSVQLAPMGIFKHVSYSMSYGQLVLFAGMLWLAGSAVVTGCTIFFSSVAKNAFTSLIIAMTAYVAPMFIPWNKLPMMELPGQLFPINQIQLQKILYFDKLHIGGAEWNVMWLAVPVTLILCTGAFILSKRFFSRHQVVGN